MTGISDAGARDTPVAVDVVVLVSPHSVRAQTQRSFQGRHCRSALQHSGAPCAGTRPDHGEALGCPAVQVHGGHTAARCTDTDPLRGDPVRLPPVCAVAFTPSVVRTDASTIDNVSTKRMM
jgi:hypothetical protein